MYLAGEDCVVQGNLVILVGIKHGDDGDQLVAVMNATGASQYEYFDGSSLDQVFADQTVLLGVLWALEDRTGAARNLISAAGVVLDHRKIDSVRRSRLKRVRRWTMTSSSAVCQGMRIPAVSTHARSRAWLDINKTTRAGLSRYRSCRLMPTE